MTTGRKKIAVFGVKTVPYSGGIENVVENTMPFVSEFDTVVYVRKKYFNNEKLDNVKLICLSHLHGRTLEAISHTVYSVFHALLIEKADIFFFHAVVLGFFTPIPKIFGKKVVLQTHGLDWKREKWGKISQYLIRFSTFLAAEVPNRTICVSEADKVFFEKKYKKVFQIVKNGVSAPDYSESHEVLIKYDLQPKSYLLFMARLVPEKGAHLLINSFISLVNNDLIGPSIKLVIAGDTNYHDTYYYELKKFASKRIIFTGFVLGDHKYSLLNNALCFIQPSTIEGMSTGILEAMRMGIVPIVSDIRENLDVIKNFGFSFKSGSIDDLSKKIVFVINGDQCARNYNMSEFTKNNYSWQNTINELKNILDEL